MLDTHGVADGQLSPILPPKRYAHKVESTFASMRQHILQVRRRDTAAARRASTGHKEIISSSYAFAGQRRRAFDYNDTLLQQQDTRPAKRARLDDREDRVGARFEAHTQAQPRAFVIKDTLHRSKMKSSKRDSDALGPVYYIIGSTVDSETVIDNEPLPADIPPEFPKLVKHVYARTMTPGLQKRQEINPTATAGLSPAQITSFLSSITASRSSAASAIAASLGIDSRFEAAASRISSRRGETYTGPLATATSSATSSNSAEASSGVESSASRTSTGMQSPSATGSASENNA